MVETEQKFREALDALKAEKPNDDSDSDRRYAIAITQLEQAIAYYLAIVHTEPSANVDLTPIAEKVWGEGSKYIHPFPEKKESADK